VRDRNGNMLIDRAKQILSRERLVDVRIRSGNAPTSPIK
jgi:hypothetical protein